MGNNTSGILGFVFACLAVVFGWLPYLGGIFWILGAILSCVGLGNRKSGWAWAGFIISFAWLIVYVVLGFIFSSFVYFTLWPYLIW